MGQWKLSYPNGLDGAASYMVGKAIYDKYGVIAITHDTTKMCRAVGQVNSVGGGGGSVITAKNITNYPNIANSTFTLAPTTFEIDEFNNGFVRMLSGVCVNKVYKIDNTTTTQLDSNTDLVTAGVLPNDYFEVVTGGCTFDFPVGRNPIRRDYKRTFKGTSLRFPYYSGGLVMPEGFEQDDIVIMTYITDERDTDRLELFLNHLLDYKGFDGLYSTGVSGVNDKGLAPMVLETGSADIRNQYLVYLTDYKIIKDAKRSNDFWEVMIHLQNFSRPLYKGI
jgi:hypothetical protein